MSKVNLLNVVYDLKKLTVSLQSLAETLDTNVSVSLAQTETPAQVIETKPAEKKLHLNRSER